MRRCLLLAAGEADFMLCGERQLPEAVRLRDSSTHCESIEDADTLSLSDG